MNISRETIRKIEHALWVSQEHAKLIHGDSHNITQLCVDARAAMFTELWEQLTEREYVELWKS